MQEEKIIKPKKTKRVKKKMKTSEKVSIVISILAVLMLVGLLTGLITVGVLLKGKPTLNIEDFSPSESSIVLDRNDNQISELGTVIRQNVEFEDLPTSLVDAFVAVEDSRFFAHNGFDVPRFSMAIFKNLKSMSFGQGGSTFTMQLVKNTYFVSDDAGTGAAKSIQRKVQEIALSLELETSATKKEIFTNYLNKLNFGGTNQNIRGIQKASQYYFGKNVSELTLPESAMLAGVINGPNLYNPFKHLDYAQDRRDEVLYLMKYHGYISDLEYKTAVATRVEDFLVDSNRANKGDHNGIPYQAYVDAVVSEVYQLTGLDPYTTPMIIHTNMDKDVQDLIDKIQAGDVDDYFSYPDEEFEAASIIMNNKTGEVIGVMGGRNYSDGGALLLNHATDQYKQPGSAIKPILVYSQAFEVLGISTSHVTMDRPLAYVGTDLIIANSNSTYKGEITLKDAVAYSLNTPAISMMRELQKEKGDTYLINYLKQLGFNIDASDFDEQYAIGGKGLQVSCEQLAGAYGAILNGGYYNKPHTIKKIEFKSDKAPVIPTYTATQTISEEACFLMADLLKNNVNGGYPNLMGIFKDDYDVYAKTGTTNWGVEGAQFNIPNGSIKDGWVVAGSSDFTVATWIGYEKGQIDKPSYMDYTLYNQNIKGRITNLILDKATEIYGKPEGISKPSGVTSITHILATFPYANVIEGMDQEYVTTGYIKRDSKYASLVSPKNVDIKDPTSAPEVLGPRYNGDITIKWPEYPDSSRLDETDDEIDISLLKKDGSVLLEAYGTKLFDYSWVYGKVVNKGRLVVNGETVREFDTDDNDKTINIKEYLKPGVDIKVEIYYGFENGNVESNSTSASVDTSAVKTIDIGNDSADAIVKMLSGIGVNTSKVDGSSEADTSKVGQVEKVEITSNGVTNTYHLGDKDININTIGAEAKVYVYVAAKVDISFSTSQSDGGTTIRATIQNNDNYKIKWSVDPDVEYSISDDNSTITIKTPGEYEVTVTLDDKNGTKRSTSVKI